MDLSQVKTVEQLASLIKSLDMVTSVAWTDYSATSTIVGWTSYTEQEIWYKKIGLLVFVQFEISGTSDGSTASFTLPYNQQSDLALALPIRIRDAGAFAIGNFGLNSGTAIVNCRADMTSTNATWTESGTKSVIGNFWYETD